jgi:hypothetical protein
MTMKPQNNAERKKAFIRFLLLYFVTTTVVVLALFFGLQVPFRENDQLQGQLNAVQKERDFNTRFTDLVKQTKLLIDTVNSAGPNTDVVDKEIADKIVEMKKILSEDSTSAKQLYTQVVLALTDAKNDKKAIRAGDKTGVLAEYERTKVDLEKKLTDYESRYRELNMYYQQCCGAK